jgi:hypothetical protein
MKLPRVVMVTWHDAFVDHDAEEVPTYVPGERISVGFLVYSKRDAFGIAQTTDHEGKDGAQAYQDTLFIPRGLVKKCRRMR